MRTDSFALRHIGPKAENLQEMLDTIGVDSIEQLIYETIPDDIRLENPLNLPKAMSENQYAEHIKKLSEKNKLSKLELSHVSPPPSDPEHAGSTSPMVPLQL